MRIKCPKSLKLFAIDMFLEKNKQKFCEKKERKKKSFQEPFYIFFWINNVILEFWK